MGAAPECAIFMVVSSGAINDQSPLFSIRLIKNVLTVHRNDRLDLYQKIKTVPSHNCLSLLSLI